MIGTGILKGMAVTARNFVGSYFEKDRLTTVQYPEERSPLPENYRNFPFLIYRRQRSARRPALRGVQDLRERMSAAVHLHRQERRQKARLHGQTAVLPEGLRHRHLGLHELPDLRRGLSVRSDQDGQGIRAESARAVRSSCFCAKSNLPNRTNTITRFIPSKRQRLTKIWRTRQPPPRRKRKLPAEAAAKAAAAQGSIRRLLTRLRGERTLPNSENEEARCLLAWFPYRIQGNISCIRLRPRTGSSLAVIPVQCLQTGACRIRITTSPQLCGGNPGPSDSLAIRWFRSAWRLIAFATWPSVLPGYCSAQLCCENRKNLRGCRKRGFSQVRGFL